MASVYYAVGVAIKNDVRFKNDVLSKLFLSNMFDKKYSFYHLIIDRLLRSASFYYAVGVIVSKLFAIFFCI